MLVTGAGGFGEPLLPIRQNERMNKDQWIDRASLDAFTSQGTTAHRLCTIDEGWAERFGPDVLISFRTERARQRLVAELTEWVESAEFVVSRVFGRFLPKKNEERETPKLLLGTAGEILQTVATENHLKFGIDFAAGYSVGLFVDQRENRRFVREAKARRLLNCFAYTCSFAVAAAAAGARILISTNCESLTEQAVERMARYALKLTRRSGGFHGQPRPADFPPGTAARSIWLTLH